MRRLVSRSKLATFVYRYLKASTRYERRAAIAIDGPQWVKRRLWRQYLTPDPGYVPVPLSPTYSAHLTALKADGICHIGGFETVAAELRALLKGLQLDGLHRDDRITDFEFDAGLTSPAVLKLLAHPELCGLICNYYGRQARYREHPMLVGMSEGGAGVERSSGRVHCDGYRQITLHLLLNDLTAADTHLVYYTGTHREPKVDYTRVAREMDGERALGIGRAGTLVLFDSGSGYHQGRYLKGQRLLLSGVITTGWLPFRDPAREDLEALRGLTLAPHVRGMFERA